jgi:hypothetical protein
MYIIQSGTTRRVMVSREKHVRNTRGREHVLKSGDRDVGLVTTLSGEMTDNAWVWAVIASQDILHVFTDDINF